MFGNYRSDYSLRSLEVIANSFFVVYLAIKHLALTSLTSLNSLTSPFAKVEFVILTLKEKSADVCLRSRHFRGLVSP